MKSQVQVWYGFVGFLTSFVILMIAIAAMMSMQQTASQTYTISGCTVIDKPGTYVLTRDISGGLLERNYDGNPFPHEPEPRACIIITSSDVTLDCKGHTITCSGGGWPTCVSVAVGKYGQTISGVVLKDCLLKSGLRRGAGGRARTYVKCENTWCGKWGVECKLVVKSYDEYGNLQWKKVVWYCEYS